MTTRAVRLERTHRRTVLAAGVLVVASVIGGWRWLAAHDRGTRRHLAAAVGVETTYDMDLQTSTAPADGPPLLAWTLAGKLALVTVRLEPTRLVEARLVDAVLDVSGTGSGATKDQKSWRDQLGEPFAIEFATDGRMLGVRQAASAPDALASAREALAAYLQIVDDDGRRTRWTVEEEDEAGHYRAEYARVRGGLHKSKLDYPHPRNAHLTYVVRSSDADIQFDDADILNDLTLDEQLRVDGTSPLPSFEGKTSLHLRRLGVRKTSSSELTALAQALELLSEHRPGDRASLGPSRSLEEARAGGRTYEEVLAILEDGSLRQPGASKEDQDRAGRAYIALTAILRLHPEDISRLVAQVGSDLSLANAIAAVLRDTGTPEAQAALQDLLRRQDLDRETRYEVARALSRVDAPTEATVRTLEALRSDDDLNVQARYGLGSNAYRLKSQQPDLANEAVGLLTQELTTTSSSARQQTLLTALGNAGVAETVPAIQPFLADSNPEVRAAAAQALRRIPGDEADQLLASAAHDDSAIVRASTFDAISERQPSGILLPAIENAAVHEPQTRARALAVGVAADWLTSFNELRPVLEVVVSTDDHADIRQRARNALARSTASL